MKRALFLLFACAAVAACDKTDDGIIRCQCGDYAVEITTSQSGDTINAVLNGDAAEFKRAVSASGAKYDGVLNDTNVTLWNKGADWTMILDDEAIECVVK